MINRLQGICLVWWEDSLLSIAKQMPAKIPTERQSMLLLDILERARSEGVDAGQGR
jgi:hypothetical protein